MNNIIIMNSIRMFLVILLSLFNVCICGLPTYKMVDLGVFGADRSEAIAVNDNGHVLGIMCDKGSEFYFIWESTSEIKIIELPQGSSNLKLNNKGQIAGCCYVNDDRQSFIWDPNMGLFYLGSLTNILDFNDNWQVIGSSLVYDNDYHPFLWDHGKMIDLTVAFKQQIIGNWSSNLVCPRLP